MPGVEVLVVDDDGVEVRRGQPGEVVLRGYNVTPGYFEDPERTAETIDPDGWLHTGDIGVMDEAWLPADHRSQEGHVHHRWFQRLSGRDREPPRCSPADRQVAVVGVPDERLGEVGVAFVVPVTGQAPDPGDRGVEHRAHGQLQGPREVRLVESLPLSTAGKVLKYQLREQVTAAADS